MAAVIATLQPYLIWHDVHGNREILDQLLGAALFGLTLLTIARRSAWLGVALGLVSGVAVLSNARLLVLPVVLALLRRPGGRRLGGGRRRSRSSRWSRWPRG